jgi:hypothetical protein
VSQDYTDTIMQDSSREENIRNVPIILLHKRNDDGKFGRLNYGLE